MADVCRWQGRAKTEAELIAVLASHVRQVHQQRGIWPRGARDEAEALAKVARHVRRTHRVQATAASLLRRSRSARGHGAATPSQSIAPGV